MKQRVKIRLDQPAVSDLARGERAVRATRRAERNADIQIAGILGAMDQPFLRRDDLIEQIEQGVPPRSVVLQPRLLIGETT